jgi:hypothetical protein
MIKSFFNVTLSKITILLVMSLLTASLVLAQGQAEVDPAPVQPTNDNLANATPIVLNLTHQTNGILGLANVEAPNETTLPQLTSCDMRRTVWYQFTAPFTGSIGLSTQGSYITLNTGYYTLDTLMAVYNGVDVNNLSLNDLWQVDCNHDFAGNNSAILQMLVNSGETYIVRVGVPSGFDQYVIGGYYRLTTSVQDAEVFSPLSLTNWDFELPLSSPSSTWKVKKALNGDGIDVNGIFKFIGGPQEATKLVQKVAWPSDVMVARINHTLEMVVDTVANDGSPNFKIVLSALYTDGTPPTKSVLRITEFFNQNALLALFFDSPNVSKVKVMVKNASTSGVVAIDNITMSYQGGLFRGEAAPLPLP